MKLRLAAPTLLVDLGGVPGLNGHRARQRRLADRRDDHATSRWCARRDLGLASVVASTIADPQVRHCGTLGGSLAHGDPASDQPAIMLAYEATVVVRGENGEREIPAAELFLDYLETAVADGEVLTEIRLPAMDGYGFGYQKFNRRQEDWAMVGVSALVKKAADGTCEDVRVGLTHMSSVPLRATAVEEALRGQPLDANSIAAAAENAAEGTEPPTDLNASADYKRHLARVLTRRALTDAVA